MKQPVLLLPLSLERRRCYESEISNIAIVNCEKEFSDKLIYDIREDLTRLRELSISKRENIHTFFPVKLRFYNFIYEFNYDGSVYKIRYPYQQMDDFYVFCHSNLNEKYAILEVK